MTKLLIGMLSLALVGVGGLVAAVDGFGEDRPVRSVSIPAGTTTEGVEDGSGTPGPTTGGTTTSATTTDASGPCDEPEHANDPRCAGGGTSTSTEDDDRSGSDHGDDNSGHRGSDDRNSGPGSNDD